MRHIRFTIASLLIVVLFVAVGFAALRESNDLWDSGVFTVTLVRWLERHDREFREDRTFAICHAGGLVWRATLSPPLPDF
jgi:hypothetical protein